MKIFASARQKRVLRYNQRMIASDRPTAMPPRVYAINSHQRGRYSGVDCMRLIILIAGNGQAPPTVPDLSSRSVFQPSEK